MKNYIHFIQITYLTMLIYYSLGIKLIIKKNCQNENLKNFNFLQKIQKNFH